VPRVEKARVQGHPNSRKVLICGRYPLDSTVLAYIMKTLNDRYQYGLELFLLSIDEGIKGYRDDSLEARNLRTLQSHYGLSLCLNTDR
jgi:tRNA(Ile)-lysidine synthase TilS/MesJ